MKINKLNNDVFYKFASKQLGVDVELYLHDLTIKRTDRGVKMCVYLGGEIEDGYKFDFRDTMCAYTNLGFKAVIQDVSREWVKHVLVYAEELSDAEKEGIVEEYNKNIEKDIQNYVINKRQGLIHSSKTDVLV